MLSIHKLLESANIKLGLVATDIMSASGRAMLRALVAGERDDGGALADLAKGLLRHKRSRLVEALTGRFTEQHASLWGELLAHLEYLEGAIARMSERIAVALEPYAEQVERLQQIPGISREAAEMVLAGVGPEMTHFPSAAHLASWAGVCPGYHESAGERKLDGSGKPVAQDVAGGMWLGGGACAANVSGCTVCPTAPALARQESGPGGGE